MNRKVGRIIEKLEIPGVTDLTSKRTRALEHLLIEKFGRKLDRAGKALGGQLDNINRGIDPRKLANYRDEINWAAGILKEMGL